MSERWQWTCGCGREVWLEDAVIQVRNDLGQPCQRRDHRTVWDGDPMDGLVGRMLGWCGCNRPEDVDAMMLAYLANINERWTTRADERDPHWGIRPTPGVSEDAETLLAYIADSLGWTEHGGSVGGAWLTDEGEVAVAALRLAPIPPP